MPFLDFLLVKVKFQVLINLFTVILTQIKLENKSIKIFLSSVRDCISALRYLGFWPWANLHFRDKNRFKFTRPCLFFSPGIVSVNEMLSGINHNGSFDRLAQDDLKDILRYLHRIGLIMWYEESTRLVGTVFVKPSFLITLFKASIIIHSWDCAKLCITNMVRRIVGVPVWSAQSALQSDPLDQMCIKV